MVTKMAVDMAKLHAVAEVYKKVIGIALSDSYRVLSEEDKSKVISEKGAIAMSNAFVDSVMESISQLTPLLELLSK